MSALVSVACPVCANNGEMLPLVTTSTDYHISKYGDLYDGNDVSQWKACGRCGFVHQNPRPSRQALQDFYLRSAYHTQPHSWDRETYTAFAYWYYKEKVEYAIRASGLTSGRVFEIGCGLGGALKVFSDYGWETSGIEPDPHLVAFANEQLGLRGVRSGLLGPDFKPDYQADIVFSNHAFEHFASLEEVMAGVDVLLKKNGVIFTAIPTFYSNRSQLSKQWMNSAHYSLFTHNSLNQLFAHYGIEELSHTYRGWRKEVDDLWHVGVRTNAKREPSIFFEDPHVIQKYVNVTNPLRSVAYFPLYAGYARRVQLVNSARWFLRLALTSPGKLVQKAFRRVFRA